MRAKRFNPGDLILYKRQKRSTCPGPRAREIDPALGGEDYSYVVEKFWVVVESLSDGRIVAQTRRSKRHVLDTSDANVKSVSWWKRLIHRKRIRDIRNAVQDSIQLT